MLSTVHSSCNILADLLIAHGVRNVVMSPGSRNAPIIMALCRREELACHVVIDERSAAFVALGMCTQSGQPVALVCTSGTALLNYAPAVAEAFYRQQPLIVVSADRPEEWIDQDDSQTLWQQDAIKPYVKRSCDVGARLGFENGPWWANRMINDVLIEAVTGRKAPVHINIRLDAPLDRQSEYARDSARVIRKLNSSTRMSVTQIRDIAKEIASPRKVMIIAGFMMPDHRLNKALVKLASRQNIVVLTETISNLHSPEFVSRIDGTLCRMSEKEKEMMQPNLVITLGGALVSRHIKEWVRKMDGVEHWHVGENHTTVDCFKKLSLRVDMPADSFMSQLASVKPRDVSSSNYSECWHELVRRSGEIHDKYIVQIPWSDMRAFSFIISHLPSNVNLHLSNGTSIRYAQLMDCRHLHRCDCNRGVSGIDGCTSTALGASVIYKGVTVLISGDMSFQYDLGALSSTLLTSRFKMIVMCNGGGGIFRFIGATSELPERDKYFVAETRLPLADICRGYG
ncbi:MAG: 2-succinyl-5-enolpyruvyl-6-hydroxy-3-cyclohexene-1-carboxylic-acid synthase, partial [Duncaniella sp.]|nr:2-succinyl-5-enolpyruvyl-6-hydroxy-3-cyclohexene-1-carboxylic-acid synthase [Duncaniella sp.]